MQEIITYIIIAFTFGLVIYKSVIKPIALKIRKFSKGIEDNKMSTPFCASCGYGYKCESCPFASADIKNILEMQNKEKANCC